MSASIVMISFSASHVRRAVPVDMMNEVAAHSDARGRWCRIVGGYKQKSARDWEYCRSTHVYNGHSKVPVAAEMPSKLVPSGHRRLKQPPAEASGRSGGRSCLIRAVAVPTTIVSGGIKHMKPTGRVTTTSNMHIHNESAHKTCHCPVYTFTDYYHQSGEF